MKKIFAGFVLFIFVLHLVPLQAVNSNASTSEIDLTLLFELEGSGYSYPFRTQFIFGFEVIIWYCQEGVLKSYIPPFENSIPHFGISLAFVGIWSATTLLNQPGDLSGFIAGPTVIVTNITLN